MTFHDLCYFPWLSRPGNMVFLNSMTLRDFPWPRGTLKTVCVCVCLTNIYLVSDCRCGRSSACTDQHHLDHRSKVHWPRSQHRCHSHCSPLDFSSVHHTTTLRTVHLHRKYRHCYWIYWTAFKTVKNKHANMVLLQTFDKRTVTIWRHVWQWMIVLIASANEVMFSQQFVRVSVCKKSRKLWPDFDDIFKEECLSDRDKSISFWRVSRFLCGSWIIFQDSLPLADGA